MQLSFAFVLRFLFEKQDLACLSFPQGHCSVNLSFCWDIPKCKTQRTAPKSAPSISKQQAVVPAGAIAQIVWLLFLFFHRFQFLTYFAVLVCVCIKRYGRRQENVEENQKRDKMYLMLVFWNLQKHMARSHQVPMFLESSLKHGVAKKNNKKKKTLKESKSLPMQLLHQYVERCRLTVFWRVNDWWLDSLLFSNIAR